MEEKQNNIQKTEGLDDKNTKNMSRLVKGDVFSGVVKILNKNKPGPVIFTVTDGFGAIDAVIKDSPFNINDIVDISGEVADRNGRKQLIINSIQKSNVDFDNILSNILDKNSMPENTKNSIDSIGYEKMNPLMIAIAKRIRRAILQNQPILLRHHNDADGITSGLAIELSCKNIIAKMNNDTQILRMASDAPVYTIDDILKDIQLGRRLFQKNKPLIVVMDNGSTPEDLLSIKILKYLGHDIIVIDHHNPVIIHEGKSLVCPFLELHLNPHLLGLDGSYSAGMLCYEIARMIDKDFDNKTNQLLPAVAAVSDRSSNMEAKTYISRSGINEVTLKKMGMCMDFIAYHARMDMDSIFFMEMLSNNDILDSIYEKITSGVQSQLESIIPYVQTFEINEYTLSLINLEKYTLRFQYPTPSKILSRLHERIVLSKTNAITIGHTGDMMIIRANKPFLSVQKIIATIQKEIPEANVEGGGHEVAGTIRFIPAHFDRIKELIKELLKNVETKT